MIRSIVWNRSRNSACRSGVPENASHNNNAAPKKKRKKRGIRPVRPDDPLGSDHDPNRDPPALVEIALPCQAAICFLKASPRRKTKSVKRYANSPNQKNKSKNVTLIPPNRKQNGVNEESASESSFSTSEELLMAVTLISTTKKTNLKTLR